MKILKTKAITLINDKISQFQIILDNATYENRYNEAYELTYHSTENLLTELFSKEEAMDFRSNVSSIIHVIGGEINCTKELQDYKGHINSCIVQLKVYRERIQNFWGTNELETTTKSAIVPFVSMSFNKSDKGINQYITDILLTSTVQQRKSSKINRS